MKQNSEFFLGKIAVYERGSKGTPLIVIAGGPGLSSSIYQMSLGELDNKTVFWDFASLGKSKKRDENSFAADTRDLEDIIKHYHGKVSLLGHSYGGLLALQAAAKFNDKIEKLFLSNTSEKLQPVFVDMPKRFATKLSQEELASLLNIFGKIGNGLSESETHTFVELEVKCHFKSLSPEKIKAYAHDWGFSVPVFLQNQDWLPVDLTNALSQVRAKTYVICGSHDVVVPPEFSQNLLKIPGAKLIEFKNSAHWPFIEEPEKFLETLSPLL
jgi:proline iminopeptidase